MASDFHFLAPYWLLAFLPLIVLVIFYHFRQKRQSSWNKIIQPHLLDYLLQENLLLHRPWGLILMLLGSAIAIVSLANPVWEKKPQSVFETPTARVIVLDLSASMNAADLKPNRMKRARLKVQDILKRQTEGQTGLVVFAGDAFTVTPLSRDNDTILSQILVLEPDIMPVQGSRLDLGLLQAADLFKQSGIPAGDILVIADGYNNQRVFDVATGIAEEGHRISVLGIGTLEGAPISNGQGDVMRDKNNVPILSRLPEERFKQLTEIGNGRYSRLALDDSDIDYLLSLPPLNLDKQLPEQFMQQNQWHENGPYLTLLLLPLAALAFRRGWLMSMLMLALFIPMPAPVMALDLDSLKWDDLWLTDEQQASRALQADNHEQAAALSSNPARKGSAFYRQQDYQQALEQFQQLNSSDAHYNRGNTLARLGEYKQAIKAYDEALKLKPDMQDAIDNRKAIEDLLAKNEETQNSPNQEQNQEEQQQESQQQESQSEQNSQQQQQSEQQEESENDQSQGNPSEDSQPDNSEPDNSSADNSQPDNSSADNRQEQDNSSSQDDTPEQSAADNNAAQTEADDTASEEQQARQAEENNRQQSLSEQDYQAQPLTDEEEQAAQQWLRRIPDDPGDLLKRKFLYQYQNRQRQPSTLQPW
ncbi:MAG: VWA domain-containing protein [Gammaproteobacteria bacterium]